MRPMRRLAWLAEVRTLARWALAVVDPHPASSLHWTGLIITGASSAWQCPSSMHHQVASPFSISETRIIVKPRKPPKGQPASQPASQDGRTFGGLFR